MIRLKNRQKDSNQKNANVIHQIVWSPAADRWLAIANSLRGIWLHKPENAEFVFGIDGIEPRSLAWSPLNGKLLATGWTDGKTRLFSISRDNRKLLTEWETHEGVVESITWCTSAHLNLISTCSGKSLSVREIQLLENEIPRIGLTMTQDTEAGIHKIAWAPNGAALAVCLAGHGVLLLRFTGKDLQQQERLDFPAVDLAWSPDSQLLALAGSEKGVLLRGPGATTRVLKSPSGGVTATSFLAGNRLVSQSDQGVLEAWDIADNSAIDL